MTDRFPLNPLPIRAKLAPRSVSQLAQLLVDWSTLPGYQFDKAYPDVQAAMGEAMASDAVRKDPRLTELAHGGRKQTNHQSVFLRMIQVEMIAAIADDRAPLVHVTLPPNDIYQGEKDYVRSLAIMSVDGDRGYTMEFASSPEEHRETWDRVEQNIHAAIKLGLSGRTLEVEDEPQ